MERIQKLLSQNLELASGDQFEVIDESRQHIGHAHDGSESESHLFIRMTAKRFGQMSRIDRHRWVHQILEPEFESGLHAVRFDLKAPGE